MTTVTTPAGTSAAQMGPLWWAGHHRHHHAHADTDGDPNSERQGFYWWEIDPTHYALVVLSRLGIVWDIRGPSPEVLREGMDR